MSTTATAAPAAGGPAKPAGPPRHDPKVITALKRFAISITVLNILGYTVLGFEQGWLWPFIAVATGYVTELALEWVSAKGEGRPPRYAGGGFKGLVEFLFPAHITSLAVNMLTYVNDRWWVMMFGVIVAVGTKHVLRAPLKGRMRHYMNPSNFGIMIILVLFPWASIAPPYHFTEYLTGTTAPGDWILPAVILTLGTMLNAKLTNRMWLIMGWLVGFALQAIIRGWMFDTSIPAALGMMTGTAFVLFTNYMVTDPGTSPSKKSSQIAFGGGVAAVYGLLMAVNITYGIFFATAIVCGIRGAYLWGLHFQEKQRAGLAKAAALRPAEPLTVVPTPAPAPGPISAPVPVPAAASAPVEAPVKLPAGADTIPVSVVPAPAADACAAGSCDHAACAASRAAAADPCAAGSCQHGKCAAMRSAAAKEKVTVTL
ncbi:enediyne biosynthesis protein [Streptomyces sp. NPDC097619]|uniref:enediyne biosynthesis protein n=1 Tax=Streptomyces sp. NPDC097619 TaxID=3157228 RepID=UPI00332C792D